MKKVLLFVGILVIVLVLGMFMNVREGLRLNDAQKAIQEDIDFLIIVRNHTGINHNADKTLGEITYSDHKSRIDTDILKNYTSEHAGVIINQETNVVDAITNLVKRRNAAR